MPSGRKHIFGGILFILLFIHILSHYYYRPSLFNIIIYISLGILFALWPDVDIKSIGQRIFYTIFLFTDIYLIVAGEFKVAAFFGLIIILPILARHRGWTHSVTAMFLVPLPILFYPIYVSRSLDFSGAPYYAAAITGYFSHLVLDKEIKLW